jgi:nicotinamidase-related amidase
MVRRTKSLTLECVLVDLNTQTDFLHLNGAYPVANSNELIPALRCVIAWAKRNYAPVISSIAAHRAYELLGCNEPVNCLDGSAGQQKVNFTVLPCHTIVEFDNTLSVPLDLFTVHQQVIFRKREDDLLGNPKADCFLTELPAEEYILFGIGLERSIKVLALGLLARNRRVSIITDACGYWDNGAADLALRQVVAKGADLITTDQLLARKLPRNRKYPLHGNGENICYRYGLLSPRNDSNGNENGKTDEDERENNGRPAPQAKQRSPNSFPSHDGPKT